MDYWYTSQNQQSATKQPETLLMSAVITMSAAIDESIRECCVDAVTQAVKELAAKYGFDAEEAQHSLKLDELKLLRKRGPVSKKSVTKSAKAKSDESKTDEPKPKRKITGYLLFSKDTRARVRQAMEVRLAEMGKDEKLKPQEVVAELAAQWKALSQEEQDAWKERAAEEAESDE